MGFVYCIVMPVSAFVLLNLIIHWWEMRKTCPSDGLAGLICGELREMQHYGWTYEPGEYSFYEYYRKDNMEVVYSNFMEESIGLKINDIQVETSPASQAALMAIVKPIRKAHIAAEKAQREAEKLQAIITASQNLLH